MRKIEQLFVRACKSPDSHKRVYSVYRRFYCRTTDTTTNSAIAGILARIYDTYLTPSATSLISDFHPGNRWKYGVEDADDYWSAAVKILTAKIRQTERSKFPDLTPPAMFRDKQTTDRIGCE